MSRELRRCNGLLKVQLFGEQAEYENKKIETEPRHGGELLAGSWHLIMDGNGDSAPFFQTLAVHSSF